MEETTPAALPQKNPRSTHSGRTCGDWLDSELLVCDCERGHALCLTRYGDEVISPAPYVVSARIEGRARVRAATPRRLVTPPAAPAATPLCDRDRVQVRTITATTTSRSRGRRAMPVSSPQPPRSASVSTRR
jgi:hypothetical protein